MPTLVPSISPIFRMFTTAGHAAELPNDRGVTEYPSGTECAESVSEYYLHTRMSILLPSIYPNFRMLTTSRRVITNAHSVTEYPSGTECADNDTEYYIHITEFSTDPFE